MKKVFLISLVAAISLFIFSCGEKKEEAPQDTPQAEQTTVDETTDATMEAEAPAEEVEVTTETGDAPVIEEKPKVSTDFSNTPLKCQIVVLDDVATGNFRKLTKSAAKDMVANGKILVVLDDNDRIFFVYNQDGSFASKKLAKYTANNFIGIKGTYKNVNGVNVIVATMIESMD